MSPFFEDTRVFADEQLRAFRDVPAAQKLTMLECARRFLERALTPGQLALMERIRRGDVDARRARGDR